MKKYRYRKRILSYLLSSGKLKAYKVDNDKFRVRWGIVGIVVYASLFLFLFWVYIKWQSIPTKKHYFHAEYVASIDSLVKCRAEFRLFYPKLFLKDEDFVQSWNEDYFYKELNEKEKYELKYGKYRVGVTFNGLTVENDAKPLRPNSRGKIKEYIGQALYDEMSDTCKKNNTYIEKYTELFFYRHLDNEETIDKTVGQMPDIKYGKTPEELCILEKNSFLLSDFEREKTLGIKTRGFEGKEININTLKQSKLGYKNITQAFLLGPHRYDYSTLLTTNLVTKISSVRTRIILNFLKMEDVSQCYYLIKLRSSSIPELLLTMDFAGTIECDFTRINDIVFNDWCIENNIDIDKQKHVNVGRNFVQLRRKNGHGDLDLHMHVKFVDMQNLQTTRLFILGLLMAVLLTGLFRSVWAVLSVGLLKRWKKKRGQKLLWLQKEEEYYKRFSEDDGDTPIVCD